MENPFGAGRSLSTDVSEQISADWEQFQSLWNRAGSFDKYTITDAFGVNVFQSLWNRARSFDAESPIDLDILAVSIPLEQGGVFRLIYGKTKFFSCLFQSLWSRAGSFDSEMKCVARKIVPFQSLWSRAGSFVSYT